MSPQKTTIWQLVQRCAEQLTNTGCVPFTRNDLIRCIQQSHPEYAANSINPIIQGVTDNLKGGAPGAIGKNILHSVARGCFVLLENAGDEKKEYPTQANHRTGPDTHANIEGLRSTKNIDLEGYRFNFVSKIEPLRDDNGSFTEFMPQDRYLNTENLPLNNYGSGPFCKFKIPGGLEVAGVYAFLSKRSVKYIGECQRLSSRFNMGYGNISPRNCFRGGQETNCRVNNLVLRTVKSGQELTLWFYETLEYKAVEAMLRRKLSPEWNRI